MEGSLDLNSALLRRLAASTPLATQPGATLPPLGVRVRGGHSEVPWRTMQRGMAPPQGLQLSILRSIIIVLSDLSWAKISAAQAPAGPPPTTATVYFMSMPPRPAARRRDCATGRREPGARATATPAKAEKRPPNPEHETPRGLVRTSLSTCYDLCMPLLLPPREPSSLPCFTTDLLVKE